MSKSMLIAAMAILLGGTTLTAEADCEIAGQIVSVNAFAQGVDIYIREGSLQNHVWAVSVNLDTNPDSPFPAVAGALLAAGHKVEVTGDAAECPTSGNPRFFGQITRLRAALYSPEFFSVVMEAPAVEGAVSEVAVVLKDGS